MDFPKRKPNRLQNFSYNTSGAYFITICTKNKKCLLSSIAGGGAFDAPSVRLTAAGRIVEKWILSGNQIAGMQVDKYVIMPNHIHLLLLADALSPPLTSTPSNARIPHYVSTLKRFCNRDAGCSLFQRSYHDHIIRNEQDYQMIWQYIDTNPARWASDCFHQS